MKKLRKLTAMLCMLVMLLALCACGSNEAPAAKPSDAPSGSEQPASDNAPEPVLIRFGNSGSESHQYQVFCNKFKELVEMETDGRISVEIYPNALLGNDREMIEGMLMGRSSAAVPPLGSRKPQSLICRSCTEIMIMHMNASTVSCSTNSAPALRHRA